MVATDCGEVLAQNALSRALSGDVLACPSQKRNMIRRFFLVRRLACARRSPCADGLGASRAEPFCDRGSCGYCRWMGVGAGSLGQRCQPVGGPSRPGSDGARRLRFPERSGTLSQGHPLHVVVREMNPKPHGTVSPLPPHCSRRRVRGRGQSGARSRHFQSSRAPPMQRSRRGRLSAPTGRSILGP
ncbi:hypothetical protein [Streptomyces sp. bgisy153]|uniref:MmyB family transcriptional regulator n=1 Tax=Streptomyces sp. bgisy153 TaxID=3413793 RepID=UPI003D73DB62